MASELEKWLLNLKYGDHVCPIYDNDEEQLATLVPFIRDGIAQNDRCVLAHHEFPEAKALAALRAAGVSPEDEQRRGRLIIVPANEAYYPGGKFEVDAVISELKRVQASALADGFTGLRWAGCMDVFEKNEPDESKKLFEYEAELNRFLKGSSTIAICQYHRTHFDSALIHDVLRTHPLVILNSVPCSNPYYEPPDLLLNPGEDAVAAFKRKRADWWLARLKQLHAEGLREAGAAGDVAQTQKMEALGRLAGGIAHDFNNLLTVINGYSELLLRDRHTPSHVRDSIEEIKKAGNQAASLTRRLLAFSRKDVAVPRVLDLNDVIRDFEKMLRRVLGEDITLLTELEPGLRPVHADAGQIEQVLMNLAVNSRHAMPLGGSLILETRNVNFESSQAGLKPGPYVLLQVTDSGMGMSEDVLKKAFEPFFTTRPAGTGLGLASVLGIVEQNGGRIVVTSKPGEGAIFRVYLPPSDKPLSPAPRAQGIVTGGNETVLLAEDNRGVRSLIHDILAAEGYSVLQADDGEQALRLALGHQGSIDLLVTDVVMPGMGGRALAERLAQAHPETKVLYLSGYTDDAVLRHGVAQEQVHFLAKPFSREGLLKMLREVLAS